MEAEGVEAKSGRPKEWEAQRVGGPEWAPRVEAEWEAERVGG